MLAKKRNLISVDIETLGVNKDVCAVGLCHYFDGIAVYNTKVIRIQSNWNDMEPRCKKEFWDKQPDSLKEYLQQNTITPYEACKEIKFYIENCIEIATKQVPDINELIIVSDNPAFDVGRLNDLLVNNLCMPLQYTTANGYVDVHCTSTIKDMFKYLGKELPPKKQLDHNPENDAIKIMDEYLFLTDTC